MQERPIPAAQLAAFAAPPPYDDATPAAAQAAVEAACAEAVACAERLAGGGAEADWKGLVGPLDAALERLEREHSLVTHLHAVAATPEWDEASAACAARAAAAMTAIGQNAGLYRRMRELEGRGEQAVPADRVRILREMLAEFEHSGVGLDEGPRRRFAANAERQAELCTTFEERLRAATAAWSETVTDEAMLGEMSPDLKAAARTDEGWVVSLLDPSYIAYMTHGSDRGLRERLMRARNARASDLGPEERSNLPLVNEILRLRWEQAELLDRPSPAALILERRMAKEPEAVADFIEELLAAARPRAEREIEELRGYAAAELGIDELMPWDTPYAAERYKQETTGLSDAQVRRYFSAERVLEGLFACCGRLFELSFEPCELPRWDDAVRTLAVRRRGELIGHLYIDLYARPTKRGGAWAHGALALCRSEAGLQLPSALINCNYTASGGRSRLGWTEVVTLFHEAGHALHHLLGKVEDFCASGLNGVEWDAVELPSQLLENFAWERDIAIGMSAHEETGEPLPGEMFDRLEAQRSFLPGMFVTRQLSLASYDLELHRRPGADPLDLWRECLGRCVVTPQLEDDRTPCSFGHIFAGGYATGYYGYLWADVLAADAYEMFGEDGADPVQVGGRFAAEVLERGGSRDAADNFRALRGREPRPEPLLRRLGLA